MNKNELISNLMVESGIQDKAVVEAILKAVPAVILAAAKAGDSVQILGLGTFAAKEKAEKSGINPLTKQPFCTPACKTLAFKVAKAAKEALN